ncbi:TetR family transcriptional regulator [Gordonia jinghuaiqii]|uniref:TetR/AcrR family transcriptional regulator n=1 Tax=Gordonia jinghuaiqii TaxID=2758710 RepID=A0A7D7LY71_9ACTN|nr:TetR/AcrR family transcriptional regulator [Gordonia jinghuaiqii]MCR5978858.1 TetR family transcriptional regulator [Gordonia jinghuaiqii]QMT01796.1 TetR/AcrR family transcriptional regulator [Gordonia jinghuaiqii]
MTSGKLWRGQTLADRSTDRREQMLAVAEVLLGSGGAGAVTMRAVVREANLSPRYFYESFRSREALLTAVYDRVADQLLAQISAQDIPAAGRGNVRALLEVCRDFFDADPGRARILLREPLADDVLRAHRAASVPAFIEAVVGTVADDHSFTPDRIPVIASALTGALVALYLDYIDGRLVLTPTQLADAAVDLVSAVAGIGTAQGDRPRTSNG